MKTEQTNLLSDLIHLASLSDNLYLQRKLEEIQEIVKENSNDFILGGLLRQIL